MKFTSTISSNGQTRIPKEVLEVLGWEPGQKIVYKIEDSGVWIEVSGKSLMSMAGALASNQPMLSKEEERRIAQDAIIQGVEKVDSQARPSKATNNDF